MMLAWCAAGAAWSETSTPRGFTDDYAAALARAKAESKIVVADFSGSDWCFWCKRLDDEVFRQEAFLSVATNKYVLLMIDSPRDKTRLSNKAKTQNRALVKQYKVTGYPTVLLLDGEGKIVGETGFVGGGAENYLKHLDEQVARIPLFTAWIKPLDRRIADFYRQYSETMTAAMKAVADQPADVRASVESRTMLSLVAELEALIADERAREVPEEVRADRTARLDQAAEGAKQLRLQALKRAPRK